MSRILLLGTQEDSEETMDQSQEDGTTTININSGSKNLCIRRIHQSRQLQRIGHRSSSTDRTLIFFGGFINVHDGRGLVLAPVLTIILFTMMPAFSQNSIDILTNWICCSQKLDQIISATWSWSVKVIGWVFWCWRPQQLKVTSK